MKENKEKLRLWSGLKWCFPFTRNEMGYVFLSLLISLSISYINTLEPIFTGSLLDKLTLSDFSGFFRLLIALFGLQGLGLLLSLISGRISLFINRRATMRGEGMFFDSTIRRENTGYIQGHEAEVLNTLQNDMSVVLSVWTSTLPGLFVSVFTLFVVSCRLITINLYVFLLTLLLSFVPFIVYHRVGRKEKVLNREGKVCGDSYVRTIQNSIALCYESTERTRSFLLSAFVERIRDNYAVSYRKLNLSQTARLVLFSINIFTVSVIYFLLGYSIYRGNNTVGDFMTGVLFSQQLRNMIQSYGGTYRTLISQSVSIDRVKAFMERKKREYLTYSPEKKPGIEICNLTFAYSDRMIFDDFNLSLEGPGLYIIKGVNGSGKTTLLKIILELVKSEKLDGTVRIGGCESGSDIAYLPSMPVLYSSSIRSNLLLGGTCTDETLVSLFEKVGLKEWLDSQENGLDTFVDTAKMGLSKGQLMRFSLLGNLARDRKIYLVDEIEDGVDAESREKVFSLLKDLSRSRLVVVVSHTSLFDDAGTIINLPCM